MESLGIEDGAEGAGLGGIESEDRVSVDVVVVMVVDVFGAVSGSPDSARTRRI